MSSGIYRYLISDAFAKSIVPLLHPDGSVIRLYRHWPTAEVTWWTASVPLSRGGKNREVMIQSLEYDLEISLQEFIDWIEDFQHGGMSLVQSEKPLPHDLHPLRFRDPSGFERVLKQCGAILLFELPHANETAGITLFSEKHADWIRQQGAEAREDTNPRLRS